MKPIAASELIINPQGAIYHVNLAPHELADLIITVGDPDRVSMVSKHFDTVTVRKNHREFVAHTGTVGSRKITVLSTGIGTDNIDIVLNELDALANINFETRTINAQHRSLKIIRIGTCGSLQADIPVDEFIASTHGLGIDNLLNFYQLEHSEAEQLLLHQFATQTQLGGSMAQPYLASASMQLLHHFVSGFHQGITVTCPGFYGPQGRVLRLGLKNPGFIDSLTRFSTGPHRIANFEMETSGIYGLGKLLGHQCLSLSVAVANRVSHTFSKDGNASVERLIKIVLEKIISHPDFD